MSQKQIKAEGIPFLIPYITVINSQRSLDFYRNAFGFKEKDVVRDDEGQITHAEMTYQDQMIMLAPEGAYGSTAKSPLSGKFECPIGLYMYVDNVDTFFKHAISQGAEVKSAPEDMFWGDRICRLIDPNGYCWCFGTTIQ